MKIEIIATKDIIVLDGVEVRPWSGRTEGGVLCVVYVHRIQVQDGEHAEFQRELRESAAPTEFELATVRKLRGLLETARPYLRSHEVQAAWLIEAEIAAALRGDL